LTSSALVSRRFSAPQADASHAIGAHRSQRVTGRHSARASVNVVGRHAYSPQGRDDAEGRPENLSRTFQLVPERDPAVDAVTRKVLLCKASGNCPLEANDSSDRRL
jgi:hypothetical protein